MSEPMSSKNEAKLIAIISHITFIGLLIALIMNSRDKSKLASFYIRQTLGIYLLWLGSFFAISIVAMVIPFLGFLNFFVWIMCIILWIISIVGAVSEEEKEVPYFGSLFQDWFKSI